MSLEWFPFKFKAFLIDTMPLNTEGKGAYLLLMLRYYDQGKPLPDDDTQLAAVCGLPADVWSRYKPALAQYFHIADGLWRHPFIDGELATAHEKIEQARAAGKASAEKRKRNRRPTGAVTSVTTSAPTSVATDATTAVGTVVEANFGTFGPQKAADAAIPTLEHHSGNETSTTVATSVRTTVPTGVQQIEHKNTEVREGANAPSPASGVLIGSLIDPAFMPTPQACEVAKADGVIREMAGWLDEWKSRCIAAGTRITNWDDAWDREYHRRMVERAKSRPKPKVAVSKRVRLTAVPDGWEPNDRHREIADERKLDIAACIESFADFITNKRPDWSDADAAFRNWLKSPHRTEFKRGQAHPTQRRAPAPGGGSILDAFDRLDATLAGAGGAAAQDQPHGQALVHRVPEE